MDVLDNTGLFNASDYTFDGIITYLWNRRGKVEAATHIPSGTTLAVKRYDLEKCHQDLDLIQHEVRMLRELQQPNVCCLLGSVSYKDEVWLLMPRHLCSAAALLQGQYSMGLPELAIALITRDILLALQYLHVRGIVHRSVQARHVLVSSGGRAVLSGLRTCLEFSSASHISGAPDDGGYKLLHSYPRHPTSLLNWASPEMLHQDLRGYGCSSDVYSLGLTVCELGNAEEPYQDLSPTFMMVEKLKGLVPFLHDSSTLASMSNSSSRNSLASNGGLQLSVDDDGSQASMERKVAVQKQRLFTASSHQFVRRTLALEPEQRPTVQQLLASDPFVKQAKKANTQNRGLLALIHAEQLNAASAERRDDSADELCNSLSNTTIDDSTWIFDAS